MADSLGLSGTNDGSFPIDSSVSSFEDDCSDLDFVIVSPEANNTHVANSKKQVKHTESSKTVTLKLNDSSDLDSRNVVGKLPHSNLV